MVSRASGNGLNGRRRNEGRNVWVEELGWVNREEVDDEASSVSGSRRGTGDGVGGDLGSDLGGEDVQT